MALAPVVVDEGVDPSRSANLAVSLAYKASPHCRCYPRGARGKSRTCIIPITVYLFRRQGRYASKVELTHRLELWSAVYETAALPVELCQHGSPAENRTPMFFFVREARFQSSHRAMVVVDGIEPPSRGLQPRATPSQLNDRIWSYRSESNGCVLSYQESA